MRTRPGREPRAEARIVRGHRLDQGLQDEELLHRLALLGERPDGRGEGGRAAVLSRFEQGVSQSRSSGHQGGQPARPDAVGVFLPEQQQPTVRTDEQVRIDNLAIEQGGGLGCERPLRRRPLGQADGQLSVRSTCGEQHPPGIAHPVQLGRPEVGAAMAGQSPGRRPAFGEHEALLPPVGEVVGAQDREGARGVVGGAGEPPHGPTRRRIVCPHHARIAVAVEDGRGDRPRQQGPQVRLVGPPVGGGAVAGITQAEVAGGLGQEVEIALLAGVGQAITLG